MKKVIPILLSLLLACSLSLAEDAVSSATLSVDRLPAVVPTGNSILVVYFSTDDTVRAAAYTVADALSAVGIRVLDHVIVCRGVCYSMAKNGITLAETAEDGKLAETAVPVSAPAVPLGWAEGGYA